MSNFSFKSNSAKPWGSIFIHFHLLTRLKTTQRCRSDFKGGPEGSISAQQNFLFLRHELTLCSFKHVDVSRRPFNCLGSLVWGAFLFFIFLGGQVKTLTSHSSSILTPYFDTVTVCKCLKGDTTVRKYYCLKQVIFMHMSKIKNKKAFTQMGPRFSSRKLWASVCLALYLSSSSYCDCLPDKRSTRPSARCYKKYDWSHQAPFICYSMVQVWWLWAHCRCLQWWTSVSMDNMPHKTPNATSCNTLFIVTLSHHRQQSEEMREDFCFVLFCFALWIQSLNKVTVMCILFNIWKKYFLFYLLR